MFDKVNDKYRKSSPLMRRTLSSSSDYSDEGDAVEIFEQNHVSSVENKEKDATSNLYSPNKQKRKLEDGKRGGECGNAHVSLSLSQFLDGRRKTFWQGMCACRRLFIIWKYGMVVDILIFWVPPPFLLFAATTSYLFIYQKKKNTDGQKFMGKGRSWLVRLPVVIQEHRWPDCRRLWSRRSRDEVCRWRHIRLPFQSC